jgi:hypothetical protein
MLPPLTRHLHLRARHEINHSHADCLRCSAVLVLGICRLGVATDVPSPARVYSTYSPYLYFDQEGDGDTVPSYRWYITANHMAWRLENDSALAPIHVSAQTEHDTLILDENGIGSGHGQPNTIGPYNLPGRFFNLRAIGTGPAGIARIVSQGDAAGQLHLVHNGGPVNQRVFRMQCANGLVSFNVVKDDLLSNRVSNAIVIKMLNGNVGLKQGNPTYPLHLASGAHCTAGGVWTNASSRTVKNNIRAITTEQARETVRALQAVGYRYNDEPDEDYVGFIAEDVPQLVASKDRTSLAPMDVVAVLTKVVQDQERQLTEERQRNDAHEITLAQLRKSDAEQKLLLDSLAKRVAALEAR